MSSLVPVHDAQGIILAHTATLDAETLSLEEAFGRTTAVDLSSDIDVAPFDNSAMDGFALRASDVQAASEDAPAKLRIVAHIPAGTWCDREIGPGECVRIMTGAATPAGIDAVEKIENVRVTGEGLVGNELVMDHPVSVGANIRYAGEEAKAGDVVLPAGSTIGPAALGLLAATGNTRIPVHRKPVVGIISLGSELIEASERPQPGQIRNSNGPALVGCVLQAGGIPRVFPTAPDEYEAIKQTLQTAIAECDFVISSGGASAGDFDYITDIAAELGEVFFKYVNMRPGKSQTFALIENTPFLGLAGNPAAAICGFELLVYPALQKMQGRAQVLHPMQTALLGADVKKKGKREAYLRAALERNEQGELVATPYKNQSSALFSTFQASNCLVHVPGEVSFLPAGSSVACIHVDLPAEAVL